MSETKPNPAPPVRTFTTSAPIKACRLRRDDLARLYRIINERQIEYGQIFVNQVLAQLPTESPDQFKERQTRVANTARGRYGTSASLRGRPRRVLWSSRARCAWRATVKPGGWRNRSSGPAVPLFSVQIHSDDALVESGPMRAPNNSATPAKAGAHRGHGSRPSPRNKVRGLKAHGKAKAEDAAFEASECV